MRLFHHGQIVSDEKVGQPQGRLELLQQVDDLGLDRDVQRADRLVADDEIGLAGQRPGNGNTLALAAGKLMGVFFAVGR